MCGQSGAKPKLYNPRHPERTLLYRTIAEHFETWHALASCGQFDGQGDDHTPRAQAFLECGIFAHGFALARCDFHVCMGNGVFEEVAGIVDGGVSASPVGVNFHAATGIATKGVLAPNSPLRAAAVAMALAAPAQAPPAQPAQPGTGVGVPIQPVPPDG